MNNKQLNEHLKTIKYELSYAEKKHTKFCDCLDSGIKFFGSKNYQVARKSLVEDFQRDNYRLQQKNNLGAMDILNEEIHEACLSYVEGDLSHCLQELAQCGAVILRTMDFVKKEMDKKNEVR